VSFFRLGQALAEMLQCISQTPLPAALWFAIVPKYWPPSADHVWASEVGKRFVSDPCSSLGQALFAAAFRTDPLCEVPGG
jgi:hypothetical protein